MPSEPLKSSGWGHVEYFSLRMDSFLVAFVLVCLVILVGIEGEVDEVMRGVLSWSEIHLLQVSVEGKKIASVFDGLLVSLLPVCIVRPIRFIMFSSMIVPLIVSPLVLNNVEQFSTHISMRVSSWCWEDVVILWVEREP